MRKAMTFCFVMLLAVFCVTMTRAQEAAKSNDAAKEPEPPVHYYHLDFAVQELGADGKVVNSRSYSSTVRTGRTEHNILIRTGSRVPVPQGPPQGPQTFQYMDIGINIDAFDAREVNGKLAFTLTADVSSLASLGGLSQASTTVVRTNRWQAPVLVPLNKPTVVFTSDALDTKGNMQLVVTATLMQ
jgi:hypothetical protein